MKTISTSAKNFEYAKELYNHSEYIKAKDIIIDMLESKEINPQSVEYSDIICYLGDCRLNIFESHEKDKLHLYRAISDYGTASNSYFAMYNIRSKELDKKIGICYTKLNT